MGRKKRNFYVVFGMKKCQSKVEVPKKLIKNVTLAMEYINEKN